MSQKLVLLVLPLLLLATAGAVPLVAGRLQAATRSGDDAGAVERAVRIGGLVQELQLERLASLGYLSGAVARDELVRHSSNVLALAQQLSTDYGPGDDQLSSVLRGVSYQSGLNGIRVQVLGKRAAGIGVYTGFTEAVTGLINLLGVTDRADRATSVGRQQLALDAILRHDEANSAAGAALFVEPGLRVTARVLGLVSAGVAVSDREEEAFVGLATPDTVELYQQVQEGASSRQLSAYLASLTQAPTTALNATVGTELLPRVQSLTALSRLVGSRVAAQAVREADDSAQRDRWLAALGLAIALLLLTGGVVLSVLVTRSISRPLRRLTISADEVADVAQQELVRVADSDDPDAAVPQLRPVQVGTSDELGELAQAFNRVQQVASDLVERQLVSRQNVATMFGNVGRRTQNLVGRQLAMIDSLERNEQDPALLDRLYRLDHVSTRLRRNANSLVVLSGADDQQISGEPLSVADTIRSALGEIEGFQRVRLGEVDNAVLTPNVTPDIILLLAELLENGTSFSPPHTEVEVDAQAIAEGDVVIRIVDHGLGMTADQLGAENGRLVSRERLDLAPTDVLGLFVVGRLARRHGIEVLLAQTPGTGVTAEVRVPSRHVVRAEKPVMRPVVPAATVVPAAPVPTEDGRGWWDPVPESDGSDPRLPELPRRGSERGGDGPAQPVSWAGAPPVTGPRSVPDAPVADPTGGFWTSRPTNGHAPVAAPTTGPLPSGGSSGRTAGPPPAAAPESPATGAAPADPPAVAPEPPVTGSAPADPRAALAPEAPAAGSATDATAPEPSSAAPVGYEVAGPVPAASAPAPTDPVAPPAAAGDADRPFAGPAGNPAGASPAGSPSAPFASPAESPSGPFASPGGSPVDPSPADSSSGPFASAARSPAGPFAGAAGWAVDRVAGDGAEAPEAAGSAGEPGGASARMRVAGAGPGDVPPVDEGSAGDGAEGDLPAPRGAAGMVRRVRGAQLPDTGGVPRRIAPAVAPPSADEARRSIEDFEAGVQRALRDTGADGIELSTEAGEAPWSQLDPADQDSADQTRALVEEFEDGVRRALARLDQFAAGPVDPVTLFERRSPIPDPRRSDDDTARPPAPPRRLDAGATGDRAGGTRPAPRGRPDPRPLERRRQPEITRPEPPAPAAAGPAPTTGSGPVARPGPASGSGPATGSGSVARPGPASDSGPASGSGPATGSGPAASGSGSGGGAGAAGAGDRAGGVPGGPGENVRRIGTNGLPDRRRAVGPGRAPDGTDAGPDGLADLVRRVPGAQLPTGARASRPGAAPEPPPGAAEAAEQDAAAARSLVEEFESGVQRALRDGDDRRTATTDEEDAR